MYSCNLYFIVTNNIFYTQHGETISEKYDLKGSSVYRSTKQPTVGQRLTCKGCHKVYLYSNGRVRDPECPLVHHQPDFMLKDNDIKGRNKFRFSTHIAKDIISRLTIDAEFLSNVYETMDYSLIGEY